MNLAGIGPVTSMLESAAAAVGASMLLGGFAIGLLGGILGWPRPMLEARVLKGGYFAGVGGAAGLIVDIIIRYLI
jgi:hypothetical protein